MSRQYNDTTNKNGIIQGIEQELGFEDGYISGNTTRMKLWTASVNQSLDKAHQIIFVADGRWQFDDSNHTDYPIITTNLVDGQRDYTFTTDGSSNLILAVHRVFVKTSSSGPYYEIFPVDVQSDREGIISGFADGQNSEGAPYTYDLTATGIFLDPIPNANVTNGLKVYISREGSYFTTSSTTKKPGFAGLYHDYCVLEPAYRYARANNLTNKETLKRDVLEIERAMTEFYSQRNKHDTFIMSNEPIDYE